MGEGWTCLAAIVLSLLALLLSALSVWVRRIPVAGSPRRLRRRAPDR